jgi:benzoyl-CoA-dihydrodiol lyase
VAHTATSDATTDAPLTFQRRAGEYRHWEVSIDEPVATVTMRVDPDGGLRDDYALKTNSYDLSVDIELADVVQRLRFEHPGVRAVVLTGGLDKVFCAGANIQMLAGATHHHKVNFCKFTNETRSAIEDATVNSGQVWLAAVNGTAAGGGYEVALACDEIILVDDRSSAVSLPEVPLLGVLPGTGGLTRLVDKRHVRRDRADVFATRAEGVRGRQAVDWRLVDSVAPPSRFAEHVAERAAARAAASGRAAGWTGVALPALSGTADADGLAHTHVRVTIDRATASAAITVSGPPPGEPVEPAGIEAAGARWWPLQASRELDDIVLHLRFNEPEVGTWILRTVGDTDAMAAVDRALDEHAAHGLVNEVRLLWARTLRRLDLSARTLVTLVEPGSCFAGTLAELVLAADRSLMLDGTFEDAAEPQEPPTLRLTGANAGRYPMANGLSRLRSRFWGDDPGFEAALATRDKDLAAAEADEVGLVTVAPDDLDWDDEVRVLLEERASFSPDALTGLEANLRFVGPETMETKIFARLTAWQNWIFQRPNASGPDGALRRFGSGSRPTFDRTRI